MLYVQRLHKSSVTNQLNCRTETVTIPHEGLGQCLKHGYNMHDPCMLVGKPARM